MALLPKGFAICVHRYVPWHSLRFRIVGSTSWNHMCVGVPPLVLPIRTMRPDGTHHYKTITLLSPNSSPSLEHRSPTSSRFLGWNVSPEPPAKLFSWFHNLMVTYGDTRGAMALYSSENTLWMYTDCFQHLLTSTDWRLMLIRCLRNLLLATVQLSSVSLYHISAVVGCGRYDNSYTFFLPEQHFSVECCVPYPVQLKIHRAKWGGL